MGICGQRITTSNKKKLKKFYEEFGGANRILTFNISLLKFRGRNFKIRDSRFAISFGSKQKMTSKMIHNSINPSVKLISLMIVSNLSIAVLCRHYPSRI
jgi:hypothetical protein